MKLKTTAISTLLDDIDAEMTGEESFPITGELLTYKELRFLISQCKGMHPNFNCLDKAELVLKLKGSGRVVLGSLLVWNREMTANFGYFFNLPLEFHAWWEPDNTELGTEIIDIALPGVISKGLKTVDNIGPVIEGRDLLVMAGSPLSWTSYTPKIILSDI